jgi:hypothetical protein
MTENDGVYQQLRGHLAALKLPAIAEALAPALEQAEQTKPGYTRFLADLLQVEVQATQERALIGASETRIACHGANPTGPVEAGTPGSAASYPRGDGR